MTDTERLDKLQRMVMERFGLSKLVSLDGNRADVRTVIDEADPEKDGYRSPEEAQLIRFTMDEKTGAEASIRYPGIIFFASEVAQMFRDGGAINVFEFQVNPPDMEPLTFRIQRTGGKTDMQLRAEALAELAQERTRRRELEEELAALRGAPITTETAME